MKFSGNGDLSVDLTLLKKLKIWAEKMGSRSVNRTKKLYNWGLNDANEASLNSTTSSSLL